MHMLLLCTWGQAGGRPTGASADSPHPVSSDGFTEPLVPTPRVQAFAEELMVVLAPASWRRKTETSVTAPPYFTKRTRYLDDY